MYILRSLSKSEAAKFSTKGVSCTFYSILQSKPLTRTLKPFTQFCQFCFTNLAHILNVYHDFKGGQHDAPTTSLLISIAGDCCFFPQFNCTDAFNTDLCNITPIVCIYLFISFFFRKPPCLPRLALNVFPYLATGSACSF